MDINKTGKHLNKDNEFHRSIKLLFYKSCRGKSDEIVKALNEGDVKLAHRLAHTLKSNAAQIGKTLLAKAAAEIEHNLKSGINHTTVQQITALESEMKVVISELEIELKPELEKTEKYSKHIACSPDSQKTQELFDKLELLLKNGNIECLNYIDDLRTIPGSEKLVQQIDDFEFEDALITLKEMRK